MNGITRSIRNAFRNVTRTTALVLILGLSLGLALAMLVAHQAVSNKISSVESSVGNTITISPAGFQQGSQNNNALTAAQLSKVKALANVSRVTESLTDRLSTTGSTNNFPSFGGGSSDSTESSTTSLSSPTTFNSDGPHFRMGGPGGSTSSDDSATTRSFSFPISFLGTTDVATVNSANLSLKNGKAISGTTDTNDAMISQAMATKNNLSVGSTFTAYDTTLTVAGIFTVSSNQDAANTVVLSLPALQRLTNQSGIVTSAIATVNTLSNLSSVTTNIKNILGDNADVTSAVDQADETVAPLKNIQTISLYSLIGSIIAGAIIIFMTMVMIVRERRREIGVIKAIGASNFKVTVQFMSEAVTLTVLAAVVGIVLGVLAASPITNMLVSNNDGSSTSQTMGARGGFPGGSPSATGGTFTMRGSTPSGGGGNFTHRTFGGASRSISHISTQVGWSIIAYGFGAAILIAVIGSGVASLFIAKIRPAEVMRTE